MAFNDDGAPEQTEEQKVINLPRDTETKSSETTVAVSSVTPQEKAPDNATETHVTQSTAMSAKTHSVKLEEELQCILCHEIMFKPVTTICGHSFCRVCLMDSFLSRDSDEAPCPICRMDLLEHLCKFTPMQWNVSVTLWNLIQLLQPKQRLATKENEEADAFAEKMDQLQAKWHIRSLQANADAYHHARENEEEEEEQVMYLESDDDQVSTAPSASRTFPEVKTEGTTDGDLRIRRNILLDLDDRNEDGGATMQLALALVEFPSILETYNEHQECSLALLRMEEEEVATDGFPYFMDESGEDDALVVPDYYNDIKLQVLDEDGNVVMERLRAARQGIVTFPGLRLDVPSGEYAFRFSDQVYGAFLHVYTRIRSPQESNDAPFNHPGEHSDEDTRAFIVDEAAERGQRGRRGRRGRREEEDDEEEEDASDDSFIVHDEEDHDVPFGRFSGSEPEEREEEEEGVWEFSEGEDEEYERRRQQRAERRREQRARRRREQQEQQDDGEEEEEEEEEEAARPRGNGRMKQQIVMDSDDEDDEEEEESKVEEEIKQEEAEEEDVKEQEEGVMEEHADEDEAHTELALQRENKKRTRHVVESDDEENEEEEEDQPPTKSHRTITEAEDATPHDVDDENAFDEDDDDDDEARFERIHPFYHEERDELHEAQDFDAEAAEEAEENDEETMPPQWFDDEEDHETDNTAMIHSEEEDQDDEAEAEERYGSDPNDPNEHEDADY